MKKKIIIIVCLVLITFGGTLIYCKNNIFNKKETLPEYTLNTEKTIQENNNNSIIDDAKEEIPTIEQSNAEDNIDLDNSVNSDNNTDATTNSNNKTPSTTKTNSNSSTNSKTTTKKSSSTSSNESTNNSSNNANSNTTKKTIVSTDTSEETEVQSVKYGTKFILVRKYTINTYSNGSIDKVLTSTYNQIDTSGYSATTNDLKSEATNLVNTNWSEYTTVLDKVNEYRSEKGESPLTLDRNLCIAATIRAMENAYKNIFAHERPNGDGPNTVLQDLGISWGAFGENIAAGQTTVAAVTNSWRNSPGHYSNMINNKYTKLGVGMIKVSGTSYGIYWTQIFTN